MLINVDVICFPISVGVMFIYVYLCLPMLIHVDFMLTYVDLLSMLIYVDLMQIYVGLC